MKGAFVIFSLDGASYDQILALETFPVAREFYFDGRLLKAMLYKFRDIPCSTKVLDFDQVMP